MQLAGIGVEHQQVRYAAGGAGAGQGRGRGKIQWGTAGKGVAEGGASMSVRAVVGRGGGWQLTQHAQVHTGRQRGAPACNRLPSFPLSLPKSVPSMT